MNQDRRHQNYGQQFGFDHYDLPPGRKNILEKIFGEDIARKASSPLVATAVLLVCGVAFAGIIIASYPDGKSEGESIPVVTADTQSYKEIPSDPGGMDIPNRGTTIFQTMADGSAKEGAPIENLLAEEKPIDKLAAFQRQVEAISAEDEATKKATTTGEKPEEQPAAETANIASAEDTASEPVALKKIVAASDADEESTPEPEQTDLASVSTSPPSDDIDIPEPKAPDVVASAEKPEIHKAGENPETLEFVRSVLDRKDGIAPAKEPAPAPKEMASAEKAAKVEPAAGAAITPGSYYVQLGSVTSEAGASTEWGKLKKSYSSLANLNYRVQKADLAKGTFYRIQAGPISKDSAKSICDSITAQKPGGCIVTQ
jgi:hypothetical protein